MKGIEHNMPEIVAPAGNLEKLRFAAHYGADAVYFGGGDFNLRMQSDNFTMGEVEEALMICSDAGVKSIFLLNAFLHEGDVPGAREKIRSLRHLRFDAIMVSDPGMMLLIREEGITSRIHLSTQMSTLNHLAVRFWQKAGIDRIVLAREATLEEIRIIRDHSDAEIEVFVHGALCVAYSGRCLLSRHLAGRDANLGDCAQSCRWRYSLVEEKRPGVYLDILENPGGTELLSSLDLCLIGKIPDYMSAGVDAFKIEGRMKSLYYAANTTRIYRHARERAAAEDFDTHLRFWRNELDLVSHRPYTEDLFGNAIADRGDGAYIRKVLFLGYRRGSGTGETVDVMVLNPIRKGEMIEVIYPIDGSVRDDACTVMDIHGEDGTGADMALPGRPWHITFDREIGEHAILRRRR
ncbi:MAG: U32 family peptidase [Spirochaetes bacterium]|nr:U32 family peptidase [Spirochaetota bacterium]